MTSGESTSQDRTAGAGRESQAPLAREKYPDGLFIVIEGIDGTGKTTLAAALADAFRARGREVATSYEPTHGLHGAKLRALATEGREGVSAEDEIELFIADRRQHLAEVVEPALAAGKVMIVDRYYFSSMAYQGAKGADPEDIRRRNEAFALRPDLLVMLELPVAEALRRITQKRGSAPDHFEGAEYLARVAQIYATVRHPRLLRLDARLETDKLVSNIMELLP